MATVLDLKRERVAVLRALLRELADEKTSVEARMAVYVQELQLMSEHVALLEAEESVAYTLTDLEALEPDALPRDTDVEVTVRPSSEDPGWSVVDLRASSPDAIVTYVLEHWGGVDSPDGYGKDEQWLRDRIEASS